MPPFFIGSDTPILDVVLISDLTVSMDRFRLNLTGSYERLADVGHNFCGSPLQDKEPTLRKTIFISCSMPIAEARQCINHYGLR